MFRRNLTTRRIALTGLLFAVLFSQSTPIFSKVLYESSWTPVSLYFMVLIVTTIFMAVHEFVQLEQGEKWGMTKDDIKGTILTAITGGVISPLLFFVGLQHVGASDAILISSIGPFFVVFFAAMFLKEKFTAATIFGGSLLVAGLIALLWPEFMKAQLGLGTSLLILAAIFGSFTTIIHKRYVKHRHLDSIVLVRTILSLVIISVWMVITEPESFHILFEPQNVWLVISLPLLGFLVPSFLYFRALKNVKAMEAGLVAGIGPIVGVLYASVFLGESIMLHQGISLVLMVIGILNINVPLTKWRIVPSRLMEIGPLRK